MKSSTLVRRFLPYYRKYGKTVAIDLFCAALTTVCELVLPLIDQSSCRRNGRPSWCGCPLPGRWT